MAGRIEWHGKEVEAQITRELSRRVKRAVAHVQTTTIKNIQKRAFQTGGSEIRYNPKRTGTASKPGEFPRADRGRLWQEIFMQMLTPLSGMVATPLKYGLILETKMQRSFLERTLNEELKTITRIITTPEIR